MAGSVSVARQYSVLIATILRFPEVASVSLDPFAREIRTQFLVRRSLGEREATELRERLADALDGYAALERKEASGRDLGLSTEGSLTTVSAVWQADRLEACEIGLMVEFLRDHLGDDLLVDAEGAGGPDEGVDEDLYMGEEIIAEKLADLSRLRGERRLVACRDEGRVIVYHR
jgi:hypothetical protein